MTLQGQVFDFTIQNSSLVGFLGKINEFTDVGQGGNLGITILLVIFGSLFFMMKTKGKENSLAVATLISSLVALFLRLLNLISDFVLYINIILLVGSIIYLIKFASPYEN